MSSNLSFLASLPLNASAPSPKNPQHPFARSQRPVGFQYTSSSLSDPKSPVESSPEALEGLTPQALAQQRSPSPSLSQAHAKNVEKEKVAKVKTKKEEEKKKHESAIQALPPNSKEEERFRTLGRYALAIANAGIFTQNMVAVLRAPVLDQVPQPLNVLGSLVNLASCFVSPVARLPMFVAGTSLYMGGSALSQSHMDQVNVSQASKSAETFFQIVEGSKWNSFKEFRHPAYLRPMSERAKAHYAQYLEYSKKKTGPKISEIMPNATAADYKGFKHMAHPGSMASLARNKYYETFFPLMDAWSPAFKNIPLPETIKYMIPSFTASTIAGTKQLGWMVGKMATDWRFAHDALMFTTRREFVKGTNITMTNAPSYVLAIGSVLPLLMLSAAMLVEGGKQAYKTTHKKGDPNNMTANESVDQSTPAKKEDPFAKKQANTVELVANVSSIIPQLANLMFLPVIWREGGGNPLNILPTGLKLNHAITPRFNAALVGTGSIGALLSALTAVGSDLSLTPRYVAYLADIAFMAFSGVTTAGLARNTFENVFRNTQSTHWWSTPNSLDHANQIAQARYKGFDKYVPNGRIPKSTPMSQLDQEASDKKP
jgi:hypothetical protein